MATCASRSRHRSLPVCLSVCLSREMARSAAGGWLPQMATRGSRGAAEAFVKKVKNRNIKTQIDCQHVHSALLCECDPCSPFPAPQHVEQQVVFIILVGLFQGLFSDGSCSLLRRQEVYHSGLSRCAAPPLCRVHRRERREVSRLRWRSSTHAGHSSRRARSEHVQVISRSLGGVLIIENIVECGRYLSGLRTRRLFCVGRGLPSA